MKIPCLLAIVVTLLCSGCKPVTVEVDTSYGTVAGIRSQGQNRFLGIPYARPPRGELRWAAPQPPIPWEGSLDASRKGPACTQYGVGIPVTVGPDEDCLSLNIWTPATPGPHPVLIWVHGGGLIAGSSNELQYDGSALAKAQNLMVVSVNYRLLTEGFFALPATGTRPAITGNQAMRDLLLALQWVQSEIAHFGGDPGNITLFGESAGSFLTCALLATPKSRSPQRLLHRVIMESGACDSLGIMTLAEAQAEGMKLVENLGCGDAPEPLDCARAAPVQALRSLTKMNMLKSLTYRLDEWRFLGGLVLDGDLYPQHPLTLLAANNHPDTPILLGSNLDEGSLFVGMLDHPDNAEDYATFLESRYPGQGEVLAGLYPMDQYRNAGHAHSALRGDFIMKCPTLNMARIYSAHNSTWHYYFTHRPNSIMMGAVSLLFGSNSPPLGTFHGADMGYVFGFPLLTAFTRQSDRDVRQVFQQAWGNFARTGNPNGPGLPLWEAFDASRNNYLEIQAQPENHDDFREGACAYWFTTQYGI